MTVRIQAAQKARIAQLYSTKEITCIKELAKLFNTSTRTIGRVLEEHDLATPHALVRGEAYQAMQVLKKYGLTPATLDTLLSKITTTKQVAPTTNARQQPALFQPQPAH